MTSIAPVKSFTLDTAIQFFAAAADKYAECAAKEMELEANRHAVKSEAISRIMALDDPQKDGKKYSATAAAALVETDAAYKFHLQDMSEAAKATIVARTQWYSALAIVNKLSEGKP